MAQIAENDFTIQMLLACPFSKENEDTQRGYWIAGAVTAHSGMNLDRESELCTQEFIDGWAWGNAFELRQGLKKQIQQHSTRPTYKELLEALEGMCLQYLTYDGDGTRLTHHFMPAGEMALDVLERAGRVRDIGGEIYEWVEGHEYASGGDANDNNPQ